MLFVLPRGRRRHFFPLYTHFQAGMAQSYGSKVWTHGLKYKVLSLSFSCVRRDSVCLPHTLGGTERRLGSLCPTLSHSPFSGKKYSFQKRHSLNSLNTLGIWKMPTAGKMNFLSVCSPFARDPVDSFESWYGYSHQEKVLGISLADFIQRLADGDTRDGTGEIL